MTNLVIDKTLKPTKGSVHFLRKDGYSPFQKITTAQAFETKQARYVKGAQLSTGYQKGYHEVPVLEGFSERLVHGTTQHMHSFVEAVHKAYDHHLPLTFYPDHVWMVVMQALAEAIDKDPEGYRYAFVAHEGQQHIEIVRNNFIKGNCGNDWEGCFAEFSSVIKETMNAEMYPLLRASFATTQATEQAAADVLFMESMKHYYSYGMSTLCGIPRVSLEGDAADWTSIVDRFDAIQDQLQSKAKALPWASSMKNVLQHFADLALGVENKEVWQNVYKLKHIGSGGPRITGWILDLFPYRKKDSYGNGFSSVPVRWRYYDQTFNMLFSSGFIGIILNQEDENAIRPEIGWCISEVDKYERQVEPIEPPEYIHVKGLSA